MGSHPECPECGSMMREHGNNSRAVYDFYVCDFDSDGCGRSWKFNGSEWTKLSDW